MARSEEFSGGYSAAQSPQYRSVQQQHNRNYQKLSVLDNLMPNQNGMGASDLQRRLVGISHSGSGTSKNTFDKSLWIEKHQELNREKNTEGQ